MSWRTVNTAVLTGGERWLFEDLARFEGVSATGVGEHLWRHAGRSDRYVTVVIDLTPFREKTGLARLLDMVQGRSRQCSSSGVPAPLTVTRRLGRY